MSKDGGKGSLKKIMTSSGLNGCIQGITDEPRGIKRKVMIISGEEEGNVTKECGGTGEEICGVMIRNVKITSKMNQKPKEEIEEDQEEENGCDDDKEGEEVQDDDEVDVEREGEDQGNNKNIIDAKIRDSEPFDCNICFKPLLPPLYQCQNGHVVCAPCFVTLKNVCHVCRLPIGDIRCRPLEKAMEAIIVPCSNFKHGCQKLVSYAEKQVHDEMICSHALCWCPVCNCDYRGPRNFLSRHIRNRHRDINQVLFTYSRIFKVALETEPFVILHGKDATTFLLLNNVEGEISRRYLSMACIRSGTSEWDFTYELVVADKVGNSLQLKASPINVKRWEGNYPTAEELVLMVPGKFCDMSKTIVVDIRIRKSSSLIVD